MPNTRSQSRKSNSPPQEKELAVSNGKLTATSLNDKSTATKRKADAEPKPVSKTSKSSKDEDVHNHHASEKLTKNKREVIVINELMEKKVDRHAVLPVEGDPQKDEAPKDPDVTMTDEQDKTNGQKAQYSETEKKGKRARDEDNKSDPKDTKDTEDTSSKGDDHVKSEGNKEDESAVVIDKETKSKDKNSSILEKGIIYFFYRPRVNVEDPSSLKDVQRSYIILRPLPMGASLKSTSLEDEGNNRLLAIPKKRFPSTSKHERFLTFVDKAKTTIADLKDSVLKSSTYQTKTMGERTNPAARPIGEGVYAVISNAQDRQSHLVYILTYPEKPDDLQKEFGLQEKGSFIISVRNPTTPAPANVAVKTPAEFPDEIMKDFNGLRWAAAEPQHLDYENAEILFIGEAKELEPDGDADKAAVEQLETLEEEDLERVKHLEGDHTIFTDLELSKKDYEGVKGTWDE